MPPTRREALMGVAAAALIAATSPVITSAHAQGVEKAAAVISPGAQKALSPESCTAVRGLIVSSLKNSKADKLSAEFKGAMVGFVKSGCQGPAQIPVLNQADQAHYKTIEDMILINTGVSLSKMGVVATTAKSVSLGLGS
jgi:hypothetical protein